MSDDTRDPAPAKGLPPIDVNEYGGKKEGVRQSTNRRLFMQLLVFRVNTPEATSAALLGALRERKIPGVVYADAMDPWSLGLLTWGEDPACFVREVRPLFAQASLTGAVLRPDFGMIGRTYSTGHEPELEWTLLRRPIENVTNEAYRWHVWYPLRRKGAFAKLEPIDQSHILREHAALGIAYGQQELAHDVRLACHGIDAGDNEFVIGLVGRDLHPLSHLVQAMRKTRQTSEFIEKMGPFFVGYVLGSSSGG
jgi:chlorite dismutase